jgi:hypothetical protein
MDYWCALWFWPIHPQRRPAEREQWWLEIGAILEGNIVDLPPQGALDFSAAPEPQPLVPEVQARRCSAPYSPMLAYAPAPPNLHDKFGQLRISKLRDHFSRVIATVEAIARQRRFMHWELTFADVFSQRGGFDLVLGNPPWLKVEWNEAGILGEANPLFAIRKLNATELAQRAVPSLRAVPGLQGGVDRRTGRGRSHAELPQRHSRTTRCSRACRPISTNASCRSAGCWPGSAAWSAICTRKGRMTTRGGALREAVYARLRAHFQFRERIAAVCEVDHHTKYSVNVYGSPQTVPALTSSLTCFPRPRWMLAMPHDGAGVVGGYKNELGKWNTAGHADRIVRSWR